jgi:uncharacterized protein YjbI with pentapeptide repeats
MLKTAPQTSEAPRKPLDQQSFETAATMHEQFLKGQGGKRAMLRFVEAPGVVLPRRLLNDVDFTGSDLSGALFAGCHFERASMHCTDLSNADLRAVNLKRADLRGASLVGASLNGAVMDEADMRAAYIAVPDGKGGVNMRWRPGPPGGGPANDNGAADFSYCTMRGARLRNANLKGANFTGAILDGADLSGAKLTDAIFHEAVLTGVALGDLLLTREQLLGCVLDPGPKALARMPAIAAMLRAAAEWVDSNGKRGAPGVLDGEDLRPLGAALRSRVLTGLSARGVCAVRLDFSGSELQGAIFDDADLRGANFEGADLRGASFRGAKLSHAALARADLRPLSLTDGKVHSADFAGALLDRADFTGTVLEGLDVAMVAPPLPLAG